VYVTVSHFDLCLSALPEKSRLGCKWLTVTNVLAYYDTKLITAVKGFIVPALGGNNSEEKISFKSDETVFQLNCLF
jgi:hypothetical protein